MTQDDIVVMARQAGFWKDLFAYPDFKEHLEAFAKLVAAKERNACIELIKSHGPTLANGFMLTEAIRAGGKA